MAKGWKIKIKEILKLQKRSGELRRKIGRTELPVTVPVPEE